MKVLFVGNFTGPGNATGEEPDEKHMARCLDQTGVQVEIADRAEVHAFFTGAKTDNIPEPSGFDLILLAKWHHFSKDMMDGLKNRYACPIVYWVWDFMVQFHKKDYANGWSPDWHYMLLESCDLYLSGELGLAGKYGRKHQYFNWDTADGQYDVAAEREEVKDVVFTGSYIAHSYRNEMLKKVSEQHNLTIFGWDFDTWRKEGFQSEPGAYGGDYRKLSANSKIMLCMNWIEPRAESIGYWSNRIGKIVSTGGFPLVHYVPGMERAFGDNVAYFYNQEDMLNQISYWLGHPEQRETQRIKAYNFGRREMTTQVSMRRLKIILENFIKK